MFLFNYFFSLADGTNDAMAYSVYPLGSDIYVAGYEYNGAYPAAKFWKNGIATSLTTGTTTGLALSIFVK